MLLRPKLPDPPHLPATPVQPSPAPCACQHHPAPAHRPRLAPSTPATGAIATVILGGVVLTALLAAVAVTAVSVAVAAIALRSLLASHHHRH